MTTPTEGRDERPTDNERSIFWEAAGDALRPYAGWLFFAFGALLVLLGWIGISGESVVAKQLPYLISGGLGGVLLAILGAYFLSIEELRRDSGRLDRMEQQIEELHRLLLARPDVPQTTPDPTTVVHSDNGHVWVVETGETFHRSNCALVAGKDSDEVDRGEAIGRGLSPCPVCEPAS